jgi:type IV pilus assembly protein PilE
MNTTHTMLRQTTVASSFQGARAASIIPVPCTTDATLPHPLKATQAAKAQTTQVAQATRKGAAGFTLIEMMIAVAVAGVLSSVAYPSFIGQVQKVRRTDAVVAMMQVQWAQERWRSNNTAFGSLAEIGVTATSAAGYYTLQVNGNSASGYEVVAAATGAQARDTNCAHLKLSMQGANTIYASGPDANVGNPASVNRQCWSL